MLVDEDLQEIFYSDNLVLAKIEMLILLPHKLVAVCFVVDKRLHDSKCDVHDILGCKCSLIFFVPAFNVIV